MNIPKRHHFLPESYLRGFTRDGFVCVYDRKEREYRWQQPRNTAVITNFYTVTNKENQNDYSIEAFLAEVESKAVPVIAKLDEGGAISAPERLNLACFIALLLTRTPKFEREITEISDRVHKIIAKEMIPDIAAAAELLSRAGTSDSVTPESMLRFVHEEQFEMVGNRNIAVTAMLDQTEKIRKEIALMDWCVMHGNGIGFVTSDSPLGFITSEEHKRSGEPVLGLASPKVTKVIPLSHRTALLIAGYGTRLGHFSVTDTHIRALNVAVASECERFVIGNSKVAVRHAVRGSKVHNSSQGTYLKVENVPHPSDPLRSFLVARRMAVNQPDKPLKISVEDKLWRE